MYKNNIKKFRKEQGLTLKMLSKRAEISAGYLCHLEKGTRKNPSTKVMENLSEILNKSISEIFFSDE